MLLCAIADTKEDKFTDFVIQLPSTVCKFNRNVLFFVCCPLDLRDTKALHKGETEFGHNQKQPSDKLNDLETVTFRSIDTGG